MSSTTWGRVPIDAQSIDAPLSLAAVFLIVSVGGTRADLCKATSVLGGLEDLIKTVGSRDLAGRLSCVAGLGSDLWHRISPERRPKELRPFAPISGAVHRAPSTPGDIIFHIRAKRADFCFEFERLLLGALGSSVTVLDETAGFRYFDSRDLLGFVDGTANPTGSDILTSALVNSEDPDFAGGSYIVVQKYLHNLGAWSQIPTPLQEEIVGRTKLDNIELDDSAVVRRSHKSLATIQDDDGNEYDILRDNMPIGRPGSQEFGTYFIGYARYLWVIEKMLHRMFVGEPPGKYDRLLDFSTALTGAIFFAPSLSMINAISEMK
jgi:putative iron-dependent peroxidase